jgi:hypothetical protein
MTDQTALEIDLDSLTIEDIEFIEDYCDLSIDEVMEGKARKGKVLRAFAYVAMRKQNPAITVEEVGKLPLAAFPDAGPLGAAVAPSKAAKPASRGSRASRKPSA